MKTRTALFVTTALNALLFCGSQALAADIVTKAPAPVAVGWWSSVFVEVGGRFFIQNDGGGTGGNFLTGPNGPTTHLNVAGPFPSLGKFYEYRDLRPGPFGEIFATGGSGDGLYQYDFLAKNIGYRDQRYVFDWSQAGVQYLTFGFDQLPHTYNDNATTVFQGAGSNTLTVPAGLQTTLANTLALPGAFNATKGATIANAVEGNLNGFRLGFDRYTGFAGYRWTPTDNWDAKVDYTITQREGTQPMGALTFNGGGTTNAERAGRIVLELPRPIHDQTHNANANVEYAGVTPWGKKFNVNFGYGFSGYHQDADSFTFQNPFVATNGAFTPRDNLMSQPPSNTANMFRFNGALDLPMKSRWVTAVSYSHGQQDSSFLPFSINPAALVQATADNGAPASIFGSSGFHSDALLVNNILTTKWTSELTQTSRYRYYNYESLKDITANYFLLADSANTIGSGTDPDDQINRRGVAYTKQNASTDFVWRPAGYRWLTLGAGAGWEQWNRRFRGHDSGDPDVRVTNEFMGKLFATAKPWDWSQFRGTYVHAERRFEGDYQQNIGGNDEACGTSESCTGFRAYDMANRNRDRLNVYMDFYAPNNLVITPTGGFRIDDYTKGGGGPTLNSYGGGLLHDNTWNAGLEVTWTLNPFITVFASFTREEGQKEIWVPFTSHSIAPALNVPWDATANDRISTWLAGADFVLIPDKWTVKGTYTLMLATGSLGNSPTNPAASFPNQTQTLNRFDVQSKYKVDPSFMQQFGFKGETYVKLRYMWERNEVSDWAAVNWNYMYLFNGDATTNKNLSLGWNNPNYNVQLLMASLALKW